MSRPASLKKPCFKANSMNVLFQNPRCATATFNVSALALTASRRGQSSGQRKKCLPHRDPPCLNQRCLVGWVEVRRRRAKPTNRESDGGLRRSAPNPPYVAPKSGWNLKCKRPRQLLGRPGLGGNLGSRACPRCGRFQPADPPAISAYRDSGGRGRSPGPPPGGWRGCAPGPP